MKQNELIRDLLSFDVAPQERIFQKKIDSLIDISYESILKVLKEEVNIYDLETESRVKILDCINNTITEAVGTAFYTGADTVSLLMGAGQSFDTFKDEKEEN